MTKTTAPAPCQAVGKHLTCIISMLPQGWPLPAHRRRSAEARNQCGAAPLAA